MYKKLRLGFRLIDLIIVSMNGMQHASVEFMKNNA
jgi:hypothetical protein